MPSDIVELAQEAVSQVILQFVFGSSWTMGNRDRMEIKPGDTAWYNHNGDLDSSTQGRGRPTKPSGVISVEARPPGVSLESMIIHDGPS